MIKLTDDRGRVFYVQAAMICAIEHCDVPGCKATISASHIYRNVQESPDEIMALIKPQC